MKNIKAIFLLFLFILCMPLMANTSDKTITIGVMNDMPPLEYYGAGYKHQGIISDFVKEVTKNLNLSIKYKASNYEKLYKLILKDKVDVLSYSVKSIRNANIFLFTSPYLEIDNAIYTKAENSVVNHIKDISHSLIALKYDNYFLATTLKKRYPDIQLRYVNSKKEALELLVSGEIESYIGDIMTTDYLISKQNLNNEIKKIYIPWLKTPIRFAVSKNRPNLYKLLQRAVEEIDYNVHNEIVKKWLHVKNRYTKLPIFLTKQENEWIQNHPNIKVGVSKEWRPFSYFENGKIQGVVSGYFDIISEKTGLNLSYQEFKLFPNMLKSIKDKKLDMIDAVVASKDRKKFMLFSNTYLSLDNIIAVRKDKHDIKSIDDLAKKRVGYLDGYIAGAYLKNDISSAKIISYKDIVVGLKALSNGDLDAFVLDLPMFDYYSAKYKITNLMVSANTPYSFPIHIGIKKDEKILKSIVDKALATISDKQKNELYRKWISVKFSQKIDYSLVWKIVGFSLLFLLGALAWNRRLSKEIEKRKIVERELIKAKEIAEKATQAKSIFLANMSHEIRTPMNSVIGFTDLLDELIKDPVQKGYLRSIKVGGKALLGIINDILDLSKIEAGRLKIVKESVHIYNLFLEIEQLFYGKISQKNLEFEINIEPDIPKYLILDGVRLRQILLNIVGNAIKFTDKGKISLKVGRIFTDENKSKLDLIFQVKDTGIGIPKEEQDKIFGDFVQQKKQSVKKYGGTGLGLSISKRLIDIMGGEIEVDSEVNKGTTFSVLLKDIGVSSLKEEDVFYEEGDVEFLESNILIVDDIEENRELIKAIFSSTRLHVKEAKDGKEAIDVVKNGDIDLVLMDLQMPTMDGYKATTILREDYAFDKLPIIALTASVMGDDLEKVPQYGFNDYLRKPASKNDITRKLSHYLPCKKPDKDETKKIDVILFKNKDSRSTFIQKMSSELFDEWRSVKDRGDMELIRNFNDKLISLLELEEISELKEYIQNISVCIDGFDLVELYELLSIYPNLLEKIKNSEVR